MHLGLCEQNDAYFCHGSDIGNTSMKRMGCVMYVSSIITDMLVQTKGNRELIGEEGGSHATARDVLKD